MSYVKFNPAIPLFIKIIEFIFISFPVRTFFGSSIISCSVDWVFFGRSSDLVFELVF